MGFTSLKILSSTSALNGLKMMKKLLLTRNLVIYSKSRKSHGPSNGKEIIQLLTKYKDVFAYEISIMPKLDPKIMCHELNIKEGFRPIRQNLRHQDPERNVAAAAKVEKLLEASFIGEFQYSKWMANVVLVKKRKQEECVWI